MRGNISIWIMVVGAIVTCAGLYAETPVPNQGQRVPQFGGGGFNQFGGGGFGGGFNQFGGGGFGGGFNQFGGGGFGGGGFGGGGGQQGNGKSREAAEKIGELGKEASKGIQENLKNFTSGQEKSLQTFMGSLKDTQVKEDNQKLLEGLGKASNETASSSNSFAAITEKILKSIDDDANTHIQVIEALSQAAKGATANPPSQTPSGPVTPTAVAQSGDPLGRIMGLSGKPAVSNPGTVRAVASPYKSPLPGGN